MNEDLETVPLDCFADVVMGQSPDSTRINSDEVGLPFLQGCAEFGRQSPQANLYCSPPLRVALSQSVLVSVRAPVGTSNWADQSYCIGRGLGAFKAKPGQSDTRFLHYALQENVAHLHRRSQGSTFSAIGGEDLKKFPVPAFDFPIQTKIASILQIIDEAIEQTETLIEKYSLVKSGMMHDLFTRGLTSDGKLRPPREEAPDLYKETPIGLLPKEWDCSDLQDLLAPVPNNLRSGPFGSALLKSELVEDGIPFLGIDNIHVERFVPVYRRFVSDRKYRELIKYSVRPNDIIITIMGTVGRCAVVPETVETALSSKHLWTISLDQSAVIPTLVCWQMNFASWVKKWFRRETQGGIMDAIQSKTLKTLKLPVPPMPEQILIADRYSALSDRLRFEQERLEKLQLQKSGLMHDLLSGEVLVKVDDAEATHV